MTISKFIISLIFYSVLAISGYSQEQFFCVSGFIKTYTSIKFSEEDQISKCKINVTNLTDSKTNDIRANKYGWYFMVLPINKKYIVSFNSPDLYLDQKYINAMISDSLIRKMENTCLFMDAFLSPPGPYYRITSTYRYDKQNNMFGFYDSKDTLTESKSIPKNFELNKTSENKRIKISTIDTSKSKTFTPAECPVFINEVESTHPIALKIKIYNNNALGKNKTVKVWLIDSLNQKNIYNRNIINEEYLQFDLPLMNKFIIEAYENEILLNRMYVSTIISEEYFRRKDTWWSYKINDLFNNNVTDSIKEISFDKTKDDFISK